MRNSNYLDKEQIEDKLIGEIFYEEDRAHRMVNGEKRSLGSQDTQADRDLSLTISRYIASGLSGSEYLKRNI